MFLYTMNIITVTLLCYFKLTEVLYFLFYPCAPVETYVKLDQNYIVLR